MTRKSKSELKRDVADLETTDEADLAPWWTAQLGAGEYNGPEPEVFRNDTTE